MTGISIGTVGAVAAVFIIAMAVDKCSVRSHEFRIACIDRGGVYIDRGGNGADCIVAGRKVSDLKSE